MAEVVEQAARFMASFAEERDGAYHLLPPVIPAQECYDMSATEDPTFELAYWWWGLESRNNGASGRGSAEILNGRRCKVSLRGRSNATVSTQPSPPNLFSSTSTTRLCLPALGVVPGTPLVDPEVMKATLTDVMATWEWDSAWGWDFPVLAMAATRLGEPTSPSTPSSCPRPRTPT